MPKVFAHMVTKDESDRYLTLVLEWLNTFTDAVHIYDDCSSDDTVSIAREAGAIVSVRDPNSVSFMDDESEFRGDAWYDMSERLTPNEGDIILAVDADEFPVAWEGERDVLLAHARDDSWDALAVRIPEVWDQGYNCLYTRTDGFWGDISGIRVARYDPEARFGTVKLAGGSVPLGGSKLPAIKMVPDFQILHFGYARKQDREAKYQRYTGRVGHSNQHIESILRNPVLEAWEGKVPFIYD